MAAVAPGVIHSYAFRSDGSQSFIYASPAISEIYGLTTEQLREDGSQARQRLHPEDADRVDRELERAESSMTIWGKVSFGKFILPKVPFGSKPVRRQFAKAMVQSFGMAS